MISFFYYMTERAVKTYIIKRNPGGPELPRRIWRLSLRDRESEAKHVSSKPSGGHLQYKSHLFIIKRICEKNM